MSLLAELASLGLAFFGATAPASAEAPASDIALGAAKVASVTAGSAVAHFEKLRLEQARLARRGAPETIQARTGRRITLPYGCGALDPKYDVLLHFHGAPTVVEPAFLKAGLDAVLVVVNLGEFSGPYERAFAGAGELERSLKAAEQLIEERCGGEHEARRVAVSGWSGGYGAVLRILAHTRAADRLDAVLLSDGMHVSFEPGRRNVPSALAMRPFARFAAQAAQGNKLFAVTHSSVVTDRYASTTQTAKALLGSVGLEPQSAKGTGPRPNMHVVTQNRVGGLSVTGYAGADAEAHCEQLRAIGDTLFPELARHWAQ
jgi:hypothetical protein